MQAGQLLHEALLGLEAVLLACHQGLRMPLMVPRPTPQRLLHPSMCSYMFAGAITAGGNFDSCTVSANYEECR